MVAIEAWGQQNLQSVRSTVRVLRGLAVAGCQGPGGSRKAILVPRARHLVPIRPHLLSAVCSLSFPLLWVTRKKNHGKSAMLQILTHISVYLCNFSKLCLHSDDIQSAGFTSFKCKSINSSFWPWKILRWAASPKPLWDYDSILHSAPNSV